VYIDRKEKFEDIELEEMIVIFD